MKSFDADALVRRFASPQGAPKKDYGAKIAAVLLCAGRGVRSGLPYNKMFFRIGDRTVLELALEALRGTGYFDAVVCAASPSDADEVLGLVGDGVIVCEGGETRTDSVRRALEAVPGDTDIVLIHDGARPFVGREMIEAVIESAIEYGSGIPAVRVVDAIKTVEDGFITGSPDREKLVCVQTPQGFRLSEIKDAYAKISGSYADDSEVYGLAGYRPHTVPGEYTNRKITTQADVFGLSAAYRIGFGYDVHRLVEGRDLVLGGIKIPHDKGLLGHSDADALVHAVMDALLSAAGMPDIGVLFPDTDPEYEGASSIMLLGKVRELARARGIKVLGLSCTVMAERPKLARHIPAMIESIAAALGVPPDIVNIGATTTEKLGVVGDGLGIAAAACLLAGL